MKRFLKKHLFQGEIRMSRLIRTYSFLLLLVFLGVVIYLNVFALNKIREQERVREQDTLGNWVQMWDNMLENNMIFIENFMANNSDMAMLGIAKTHEDQVYALLELKNTLDEYALLNYGMNELFFYSEELGENGYLTSYRYNMDISSNTMKERIRDIIAIYKSEGTMRRWMIEKIGGQNYLMYLTEKSGRYAGCWCSVEYLIRQIIPEHLASRNFFIVDEDGVSRTDNYLDGETIDLSAMNWYSPQDQVQYRQISMKSDLMNVYFAEHIEKSAEEESILQVRNVMVIMSVILGVLLVLFSGYLEYFMYRPIRSLVSRMLLISEGNFESKITDTTNLKEIRILNTTFNKMVDEIKHLKIAIYEDALREQKVRLQYLQMQIRPHFLVNALNSVCTMIDMKNDAGARQMCVFLARYFRFLYNKNTDMIVITEELAHVETYVRIQEMRRPGHITFDCEIDEDCRVCLVPPLLLQTFVENSIKYGIDMERQMNTIAIRVFREASMAQILIRDCGPGFPVEVLDCIHQARPIVRESRECVGIHNVFARLRLFYGDSVEMTAYNDGGAVVRIGIPM